MSSTTLLIFEGVRTEQNIVNNLEEFFFVDTGNTVVRASYGHNIYQLYEAFNDDDGLDLIGIIQEKIATRETITAYDQVILNLQDTDAVSDIYLFFDYDPHTTNASDEKLTKMLKRFDDAMDKGLLCISYPMVEAIRHMPGTEPSEVLHSVNDLTNYKRYLKQKDTNNEFSHILQRYLNWGMYDLAIWSQIINVNLCRANHLTHEHLSLPDEPVLQQAIFNAQVEKHIPSQMIAVISAFPLMLHQHYGDKLFAKMTSASSNSK